MKYSVYSKANCSFCTRAKMLLSQKGLEYEELDVSTPEGKQLLLDRIEAAGAPAPKTVPQIFLGEHHVGGYEQLKELLEKVA